MDQKLAKINYALDEADYSIWLWYWCGKFSNITLIKQYFWIRILKLKCYFRTEQRFLSKFKIPKNLGWQVHIAKKIQETIDFRNSNKLNRGIISYY
jgi:hypothetical protein